VEAGVRMSVADEDQAHHVTVRAERLESARGVVR
jgi:hypothetical protein